MRESNESVSGSRMCVCTGMEGLGLEIARDAAQLAKLLQVVEVVIIEAKEGTHGGESIGDVGWSELVQSVEHESLGLSRRLEIEKILGADLAKASWARVNRAERRLGG